MVSQRAQVRKRLIVAASRSLLRSPTSLRQAGKRVEEVHWR
jgi:hypothetical protein